MRHLLVSSAGAGLADGLRPLVPADTVLLSARGVDDTLERLARSFRVDAVVTDDPAVAAAIREEVPGSLPIVVVARTASPREALRALAALLEP